MTSCIELEDPGEDVWLNAQVWGSGERRLDVHTWEDTAPADPAIPVSPSAFSPGSLYLNVHIL